MSRSNWKGLYISNKLLTINLKSDTTKYYFTQDRNSTVIKNFTKKEFQIYNGYNYKRIKIKKSMWKHKLGEFNRTRKYPNHKGR